MTVRDSITRTGARTPGAEDYPTSMAAHGRAPIPTQCGITAVVSTCAKGRHKPNISRCMPGAGLSRSMRGKVLPYMPAFQPYRGKPAVRNDREGRGNVGIIEARSAPRLYPTEGLGVQFPGPTRQLELAILNLAINARDAMLAGGKLTITTKNVASGYRSRLLGIDPGDYVM